MSDLPKRLRIKASMIALGERIAWGSDTAIMEEAADMIESLIASIENHQLHMLGMARDRDRLRDMLSEQQQASAAQSAPAGEREAEAAAIAEEINWLIRQWDAKASWSGERMAELLEAAGKASEMLASWQRTQAAGVPEAKVTGAWESARIGDFNAGWNACRDSVFTLMKKAAYMELDTTKRSIATQDELRALLAAAPAHPAERQEQGEVRRLRDWVACVERLPADKRDVMVYCADSDEHMVGSSIGDGLFLFATASNGEKVVCRPTHWRYIDESDKPDLAASTGQEVS